MAHAPNMLRRSDAADQLRDKLKELREKDPANYASGSTRMLREIERLESKKHRYAKT